MSIPSRQFAIEAAAVMLVLSLVWPYYGVHFVELPWLEIAFAIGVSAAIFARIAKQPWWWWLIHGAFMPLVWAVYQLAIPPLWFLCAFFLLLLIYRGALSGQVPLFFSNRATVGALAQLLEERPNANFLDLGAGIGSCLIPLADAFPEHHFVGIENAPLTWLMGRILSIGRPHIDWRFGDMEKISLARADVVYAFLSPAPMPRLWEKVKAEMRPGTLFISNSFAVPDVLADKIIGAHEGQRVLYGYFL